MPLSCHRERDQPRFTLKPKIAFLDGLRPVRSEPKRWANEAHVASRNASTDGEHTLGREEWSA
jgi:hypothetical protein